MNNFINKIKIRYKLLAGLLLTSIVFVYLAIQMNVIISNIDKQNKILESGVNFTDAIFEAKYFLRSDMHILLELVMSKDQSSFDYWWVEHNFQIQFFNDQIKKIEENTLLRNNKEFQELVNEIIKETNEIKYIHTEEFIDNFGNIRNRKFEEFEILSEFNEYTLSDSLINLHNNKLINLRQKMTGINEKSSEIGLQIITKLDIAKTSAQLIVNSTKKLSQRKISSAYILILTVIIIGLILSILFTSYMSRVISGPVIKIREFVDKLSLGMRPGKIELKLKDEIGDIAFSLNKLIDGLKRTADFSSHIGHGKLEEEFEPLSEHDVLGNSLLEMRDSLAKAEKEDKERKDENEKRNWATEGLAKFGDILRTFNENFQVLTFNIMSNLVEYLDVIQGAMFVLNDDDKNDIYYELTSAIAFGRNKLMTKHIRLGVGLVGRAAHEKMTILLTEIPDDYAFITSGLGDANPRSILIIPLKLNEQVLGVIELASFKDFKKHEIEFLEQLGEDIASIISSVKVSVKTTQLLEESQHQSEELAAQEEEMRQNMEELQATQEEAGRREEEMSSLWGALNQSSIVVELEMDGTIINLNDRNSDLIGLSKEQMIGKNHRDFAIEAKEDTQWYKKFWEDLNNGIVRERLLHVEIEKKDLWIHETYTPIQNIEGEFVKVLNIGNDITGYKQKEFELQKKLDEINKG